MRQLANGIFILLFLVSFLAGNAQHQELKYQQNADEILPDWAQLMYSDAADPGNVKELYDAYYLAHDFVKNQHTQYYKHWLRNISRDHNGLFWNDGNLDELKVRKNDKKYLQKKLENEAIMTPTSAWACIGPIDYDHDAAGRSYAPGSAHVYTLEQANTDVNTLWAGTATAGIYKSTDYGLNWELMTRNLIIGGSRALEIDHANANIVYFNANGNIYKTTDGGTTWAVIGDAAFQAIDISAGDIVMDASDNMTLYICSSDGLYQTTDGGNNWTQIKGGEWQELEFHPTNADIIYAVKLNGNHTEFHKSTDGGTTWTMKPTGWPGLGASTATTFNALENAGATSDYINLATNPNLGTGANADFTIELRIKSAGWSGDPSIISNKDWASGGNAGFVVAANGGGWKFNIGDGTSRIDLDGSAINDNEWHHLAISYDQDGTKTVYQDGAAINSSTDVLANSTATALALNLLQDGTGTYGYGLNASIADVRIWSAALDAATIDSYRCSEVDNTHPNYANLVHYWKINENTGTIISDSKGTNNGTINGSSTWNANNDLTCVLLGLEAGEEQRRTEIAVSPADPNLVVAQASGAVNGGTGLFGIYKSTDAGETWTFSCCGTEPGGPASSTNQNMMGYAKDGSADGGQYYYDMALDISKTNANHISMAGVQRWQTLDGGATWNCPAKWSEPGIASYIHADIHDLRYLANGDIFVACDGGIYYSNDNGSTFTRRQYGIAGTDFWGFGAGFQDGELMVGGTYHNSTLLKDGNTYINGWISTAIGGAGGDNVRGYTNFGKEDVLYMDAGRRKVPHNRNVGFSDASLALQVNASYTVGESSDMAFDPRNYNVYYIGNETTLYRTEDEGSSFDVVHDFGEKVTSIAIGWDNPEIMYVCTYIDWWGEKKIYRSADAGATFTQLTKPYSGSLWSPLDVTVSSSNADEIWIARCPQSGGYNSLDGEKVYHSTDGGQSWTNLTTATLDGEHLTNIVHQRGTNGGVYIGTRRGVYYRNNTMADWALFTNNLPARTFSTRLIPFYRGNKLRNGTDRSVWEVEFYEPSAPDAQIAVDRFDSYCARQEIQFLDHSAALDNATYSWSFPGGTPVTSSDRNPMVSYAAEGTYSATLTVTDANGSDTQTLTDFITVYSSDCIPENIPDVALDASSNGYVNLGRPEDLNFNGNDNFTFTAWVKPSVDNMNGYILTKYDRHVAGQYFFAIENGKLVAAREVEPWNVTGATDLVSGQWYHVAATYDGLNLRVYVNGELDGTTTMGGSIGSIGKDVLIGARHKNGVVDDYFQGLIDEVAIWKRELTQNEIREFRHLTLDQVSDTDLVGYYQFNETGTTVYDRGGFNNGEMESGAVRSTSSAPVGGGFSHRMDVTDGGTKTFTNTGLNLTFPATGTYPDGELVATRINLNPDQLPSIDAINDVYWLVNNYGNNATFDVLESISFDNVGTIGAAQDASEFKLYKRNSNDDGTTWGSSIDFADAITTGANGSVTFSTANTITSFSQFSISNENAVLPVDWLYFRANLTNENTVQLDWATAAEMNSDKFLIERSADGTTYEVIGSVSAKGNSEGTMTYRDYDVQPLRGTSYYRLRQIDTDGSAQYSEVRSIVFDALPNHFAVYPNPIKANANLQIISDLNEDLLVQIYNAKGRMVINATVANGIGEIPLMGLSSGAYFYKIIGNTKMTMGKVVVN